MRKYTGKATTHKHLLSNMLKCGKCGRKVSGRIIKQYVKNKDNVKVEYEHKSYVCISQRKKETNCKKPTIKLGKLDDLIWAKFVMDNSLSKLIVSHFKTTKNNDNLTALKGDLKSLESSKKKLLKDKDKLIQLVLDGVLSNEDTKSKMDAIKSSIKDTDTKILKVRNLNFLKFQKLEYIFSRFQLFGPNQLLGRTSFSAILLLGPYCTSPINI